MSAVVMHAASERSINSYIAKPGHAVMLVGPSGIGKTSIAEHIVSKLLELSSEQLKTYAYYRIVTPINSTISIEQAREVTALFKLKTTGKRTIRRVVVIEDAHTMTIEAQNALLKAIEEPPSDTIMILTVSDETKLLSTIQSRTQTIKLIAPSKEALQMHFAEQGYQLTDIDRTYALSGGLVGLMKALLDNKTEHELVAAIEQAKSILVANVYARLAMVDMLAKQKQTNILLFAFGQIAQSGLQSASRANNNEALKRWYKVLAATHEAEVLFAANAQAKLVLTNFMLKV